MFGLYRIPFYLGFSIERLHSTQKYKRVMDSSFVFGTRHLLQNITIAKNALLGLMIFWFIGLLKFFSCNYDCCIYIFQWLLV